MCSRRTVFLFLALAAGFFGSRIVFSQDAAAPPAVPDYYDGHATDTNSDGKVDDKDTAKWPDATGAAAGYWTTPAASPGDDDPAKLTVPGLYDRVAHNLFSINFVICVSKCVSCCG